MFWLSRIELGHYLELKLSNPTHELTTFQEWDQHICPQCHAPLQNGLYALEPALTLLRCPHAHGQLLTAQELTAIYQYRQQLERTSPEQLAQWQELAEAGRQQFAATTPRLGKKFKERVREFLRAN